MADSNRDVAETYTDWCIVLEVRSDAAVVTERGRFQPSVLLHVAIIQVAFEPRCFCTCIPVSQVSGYSSTPKPIGGRLRVGGVFRTLAQPPGRFLGMKTRSYPTAGEISRSILG